MYRQPGHKYVAHIDTYCTVDPRFKRITQIQAKVRLTKSQLIVSLNLNSTVRLYYKVIRHIKYGSRWILEYQITLRLKIMSVHERELMNVAKFVNTVHTCRYKHTE